MKGLAGGSLCLSPTSLHPDHSPPGGCHPQPGPAFLPYSLSHLPIVSETTLTGTQRTTLAVLSSQAENQDQPQHSRKQSETSRTAKTDGQDREPNQGDVEPPLGTGRSWAQVFDALNPGSPGRGRCFARGLHSSARGALSGRGLLGKAAEASTAEQMLDECTPYNPFFLRISDSSFCLSVREWLSKVAFDACISLRGSMALWPLVCEETRGPLYPE